VSADTRRTVVVAQTTDHALAHIWRTALEAEGIPAIVSGEFLGRLYAGIPQVAAVTVTVFEQDAERAAALLAGDAGDRDAEGELRADGDPSEDDRSPTDGDGPDERDPRAH
jgi:hypothetical protein